MNIEFNDKADYQEYFGRAHKMVRRSVKEFVDKEIIPHVDDWEEMGEFVSWDTNASKYYMEQFGSIAGQFEREFGLNRWSNIGSNCLIRI